MGVTVLNPHDCLQNPLPSHQPLISLPPRMKPTRNPNPSSNRASRNRRKRSPNTSPPSPPAATPHARAKNLVMGQVKILKRGEQLPKSTPEKAAEIEKIGDLDLGSTDRLGPVPESVPTQIKLAVSNRSSGFYAGSAFVTSPPPSSLPLPAFLVKKSVGVSNDDASSGLRRILGLSL